MTLQDERSISTDVSRFMSHKDIISMKTYIILINLSK